MPEPKLQRVLVVEDDPFVCAMLQAMLATSGIEAVPCGDGQEGVRLFSEAAVAFDAVLTDYHLPGLTGAQVYVCLRQLRAEIPVVLMSADPNLERFRLPPFSADPNFALLSKPFAMDALEKVLRRMGLGAGRAQAFRRI